MGFGFGNKKNGPFSSVNNHTSCLQNGHPTASKTTPTAVPPNLLVSYPKADVEAVCKALLEDYIYHNDGDYGDHTHECIHCGSKTSPYSCYEEIENIKHELDCLVLVARDLLTGS